MSRRPLIPALLLAIAVACDGGPAPEIDTSGMELPVRELIRERRAAVAGAPDAENWGALGDALLAHGLEREAAFCYARAVPLSDDPFEWIYLQALADRESTEMLLERAGTLRPDAPLVALRLGLFYQEHGRHEDALGAFERARRLDPALQRADRGLGQSALALGDVETATAALERAVKTFPGDAAGWSALAQAYAAADRGDDAREAARRAARGTETPGFADPIWERHVIESGVSSSRRFQRALRALAGNDLDAARRHVEAILALHADEADALHLMGLIEVRSGDDEAAAGRFERALEADPGHARSVLELAAAAERLGRLDEALRHYERALELTPHDSAIVLAIARLEHRRNDVDGVRGALEKLVALRPDDTTYRLDLGDLYAHARRWDEAEAQYREALRLDPSLADAHYRLGLLYESSSRERLAAAAYERALELDPASPARSKLGRASAD